MHACMHACIDSQTPRHGSRYTHDELHNMQGAYCSSAKGNLPMHDRALNLVH